MERDAAMVVPVRRLRARPNGERVFGRFSTTSAAHAYKYEVKKIKKHARTATWTDMFTDDVHPTNFGNRMFERLVQKLTAENLQTGRMVVRHYEWLLPRLDATPRQLAIFDALSHRALTVSDDELKEIMDLEISTTSSPPSAKGYHFYIRSWQFSGQELEMLIKLLEEDDSQLQELREWRKVLDIHYNSNTASPVTFTIRYLGTVKGPRRPIDRHLEDLKLTLKFGDMRKFHEALKTWFPSISEKAKVFLLPKASQTLDSDLFAEDTERLLIQLFHHPSLLNRQRGGFYSSFLPDEDDAEIFRDMKTDVWNNFDRNCTFPALRMLKELEAHAREVQDYANTNADETGTARYPYTDHLRDITMDQASPHQYLGHTLLLFIGKDITVSEYVAEDKFMEGSSRAGVLTRDIFLRINRAEIQSHGRNDFENNFKPTTLCCFVDLWPWLWHRNIQQAVNNLHDYIEITQPIITVSFGRTVSKIVRSGFKDFSDIREDSFIPHVPKAKIRYYGSLPTAEDYDDTAFINIPHIHPGKDKHGAEDIRLRRLFELTMQYTFLVTHVAMRVLNAHTKDAFLPTRKGICIQILQSVNDLKEEGRFQQFFQNLDVAREGAIEHGRQIRSKISAQYYLVSLEQQDRPIEVTAPRGDVNIGWLRDDGESVYIRARCKLAIPRNGSASRSLHFHQDGLDILDENGDAFLTQLAGGAWSNATFPYRELVRYPNLKELWCAVLHSHGITLPSDALETATPIQEWGDAGLQAVSSQASSEKPLQNRPPQPGDAKYLLQAFLDEYFPIGGTFESISKIDYPTSPAHMDAFRAFIKRAKWAGHPYQQFWLGKFDIDIPQTGVLAKNIPLFRSCTSYRRSLISHSRLNESGKKLTVWNMKYDIGPPGSALANPFQDGSAQSCMSTRTNNEKSRSQKRKQEMDSADDGEDGSPAASRPRKKLKRGKKVAVAENDDE